MHKTVGMDQQPASIAQPIGVEHFNAGTGPFADAPRNYSIETYADGTYIIQIEPQITGDLPDRYFLGPEYIQQYQQFVRPERVQSPSWQQSASPPHESRGFVSLSPRSDTTLFGNIPTELRSLISQQQQHVTSVVDKPVTEEEFTWLVGIRRIITIVSLSKNHFQVSSLKPDPLLPPNLDVGTIQEGGVVVAVNQQHGPDNYVVYGTGAQHNPNRSDVISGFLVTIASFLDVEPKPRQNPPGAAPALDAIWLLDAKSIFMLLKRRYQKEGFENAVIQARARTAKFLDKLIKYWLDVDILALEMYFWGSATNMELEIAPMEFKIEPRTRDVNLRIERRWISYDDAVRVALEHFY